MFRRSALRAGACAFDHGMGFAEAQAILAGNAERTRAVCTPETNLSAADPRTDLSFGRHSRTNPSARRYADELSSERHSPNEPGVRVPTNPSVVNPNEADGAHPNEPNRRRVQERIEALRKSERTRAARKV
jgi:hypothetical protein